MPSLGAADIAHLANARHSVSNWHRRFADSPVGRVHGVQPMFFLSGSTRRLATTPAMLARSWATRWMTQWTLGRIPSGE